MDEVEPRVLPEPYAHEYGSSNGDGTFSVHIHTGRPFDPITDWPVTPLHTEKTVLSLLADSEAEGAAQKIEINRLRSMLFPYADSTEISGMSWNGFYLIGDEKSIRELKRVDHRSSQLEAFSKAYDERLSSALAEIEELKTMLRKID